MASFKGWIETVLASSVALFVIGLWAGSGFVMPSSVLQAGEAVLGLLIGGAFVGSIVYGLGLAYRKAGLKVGARGALIYFAIMLVALLVRFLLFGPP